MLPVPGPCPPFYRRMPVRLPSRTRRERLFCRAARPERYGAKTEKLPNKTVVIEREVCYNTFYES